MNLWSQAERVVNRLEEIHPWLARAALSYASLGQFKVKIWEDQRIWIELSKPETLGEVLSAAEAALRLLWRRHEKTEDLHLLEARIQGEIPLDKTLGIRYEVSDDERENLLLRAYRQGQEDFMATLWVMTPVGIRLGSVELHLRWKKGRYLP